MAPVIENEGVRRRSLSGASALIARRFTRQTSAPRPVASRSESTTRRRATIASTNTPTTTTTSTTTNTTNTSGVKVHVRIVPNIENPSRSLIFDIVDRELQVGSVIRIGRYSERHANLNCMSFKSKVVSRCHSEVWVETNGKLYIRDTKSSSGTFLNHVRLSPAGNESRPVELSDGDIVQLGVDFQGGREEMYRSVKMRFELNRSSRPRPLSFSLNAFQNLRNLTHNQQQQQQQQEQEQEHEKDQCVTIQKDNVRPTTKITSKSCTPALKNPTNDDIDECCICLYALAPFQALFVSPCSHTYHFKCIRPLLSSYPGFQCPICRTYSDLEASVAIEADEVMEQYIQRKNTTNAPEADSGLGLQSDQNQPTTTTIESSIIHPTSCSLIQSAPDDLNDDNAADSTALVHTIDDNNYTPRPPLHVTDPYSTTFISSPVIYSETIPDSLPLDQGM
ncbi:hypothetical protein HPULCUR_005007 [Helicostylum pulchrum]|uniref:SMAD/FHA domain-containing protein n=1 Tax=Helicostylum pulchrum TaxID=562976 RepID=A0ABP9XXU6_9FUNG